MFDRLIHRIKSVYRRFENPLLMKELRQAMRSRIYVYVFMSILFVSLFLMALFLLTHRGRVELTRGVGRTAFGLLYVSFVSVALLMIPMTAFLSQREEVEKDRLDLIRITNLTPSQIVYRRVTTYISQLLGKRKRTEPPEPERTPRPDIAQKEGEQVKREMEERKRSEPSQEEAESEADSSSAEVFGRAKERARRRLDRQDEE